MVNDINNIRNTSITDTKQSQDLKVKASSTVSKANHYSYNDDSSSESTIKLSNLAKKLAELEDKAKSGGEINESKVAEIKSQLANDTYTIDPSSIATSLIQEELSLGLN